MIISGKSVADKCENSFLISLVALEELFQIRTVTLHHKLNVLNSIVYRVASRILIVKFDISCAVSSFLKYVSCKTLNSFYVIFKNKMFGDC